MIKATTNAALALRPAASNSVASSSMRAGLLCRPYATQNTQQTGLGATTIGPKRRRVTAFNDDGYVPWNELSAGEKAARASQQTYNLGMILVGVVLTGGVSYFLWHDVFSPDSKTSQFNRAVDKIKDYASILKWMSFFNSEVLPPLGGWFRPLLGLDSYNKKNVEESSKKALRAIGAVETHLVRHTYLVGDRITLADLFAASIITRGFQYFFDKQWRQENPTTTRWYETVINQPIYSAVADKLEFLEKPKLTNVAPKVEKKEAPKPAAAPAAASEEPAAPAPKPKHPCDLLPKSAFPLDEWKRYFSNNKESESLPWFWDNVPFADYSIWRVDYKYNDELTLVFMSNNLIGGFNARLEASRKHLFGSASVYGENNNSVIQGAFVIRGQEYLPVFDVAPDYESYTFTKLDHTKPEDREFLEAMWKWDKPVVVDGKEYPHADGKVFK